MFKGSIVAIITPMTEKGKICRNSLKKLVQYHIKNHTTAIVSVGTTGESATLNQEEHNYTILSTLEFADGKIPIIAGTGANSTYEAITLTKKLENSGIRGCLSVVPYYNKPTQNGLYQHFKSISENTNIPQILYNVPSRTGCDMLPETVIKLSKLNNIIGIKEATGDLTRIHQIKQYVKKNFLIISGDDTTALDFMQLGGDGVISVTANIAAQEMSQMCLLALQNDFINARIINKKLMPIHQALFLESNPIPIKWAAFKLGMINNDTLRLPLTTLSYTTQKILQKALIKSKMIS
ncbi:4-hydroxy-tetrahydrodipicolinate synthase [Buchnera aphidicola]|uniref:4-hydroxy-tetrahydrodipicolinate synthase n=1 Tax=Buchnera aphidicola (Sarucallis kahawaluokalani) TaxID=1241878 RepID=A0A4D6Y9L1_9GAMM|nr:4-hydroxy-tetrahydrodipicolinate synthase [Buchnera aphidicola]QCI25872.1 4-hydroxy-tetrahydrodipicolinate synthase [Buchnera aphidicola (Sarucallis kahawaluokalani)]